MTDIKQRIVYVLTRKNKADDDDADMYVGCTSVSLKRRLHCHRSRAKNFIKCGFKENNRLYKRMNEVGLGNWEILPLLGRTCGKKEAFSGEQQDVYKEVRFKILPVLWKNHRAVERKKQRKLTVLANELHGAGRVVEAHIVRTVVKPYIRDMNLKWSKMTALEKLKAVPPLLTPATNLQAA